VKIHEGIQGTDEWFQLRCGVVTASEFDNLVTPKWKIREPSSGMFQTYLNKKLAERWTGSPVEEAFSSFATEQGSLLEDEAFNWVAFKLDSEFNRAAFITTDDGRAGCSPDGIIGECGLELKCPRPPAQVKYLLEDGLPEQYAPQVHFSMFVTGWQSWRFVSYSRRLPKLNLGIERDEKIQAVIAEALAGFLEHLDDGYARLVEKNGGEPYRPQPVEPEPAEEDRFDILN